MKLIVIHYPRFISAADGRKMDRLALALSENAFPGIS